MNIFNKEKHNWSKWSDKERFYCKKEYNWSIKTEYYEERQYRTCKDCNLIEFKKV